MLAVITVFTTLAMDLVSKQWARQNSFIENQNFTFGLPGGKNVSLITTAFILAAFFTFYKKHRTSFSKLENIALGLIIGGACSNLYERLFRGAITDFIKIGKSLLNFADLAIFGGIILMLFCLIKNNYAH